MKHKRMLSLLLAGVMALSLAACGQQSTAPEQSSSQEPELPEGVVQTTAGQVQGTNEDGIYRYLGVPYAEARERFVPAEEVTPWEGIRMADSYGPMSPQGTISGIGGADAQDGTDNNSQNLNIWTPGINDGEKRPVMVWLHGGDPNNVTVFGQSGGGAKVLALMNILYPDYVY